MNFNVLDEPDLWPLDRNAPVFSADLADEEKAVPCWYDILLLDWAAQVLDLWRRKR